MSTTSYNRLRAGIIQDTHTISAPVVPVAIDLAHTPRKRSGGPAPVAGNASRGGPLAGIGSFTNDLIASAQRGKKPGDGKAGQSIDQADAKIREWAFNEPDASQQHRNATLQQYTDAAEATAAQRGSQRHGIDLTGTKYSPTNTNVATSTADTRWAKGPLGSFGEPAGSPYGVTPATFGTAGGDFSGV